mmetsp:Transcript_4862/g.12449  ORF Transcript_4862/g.12449 Transcript_4862/m.12449 type:complete len:169 (-) Transcript_4862:746-1252(-)
MSATLHTSLGDVKVELACEEVPRLCFNWLALAASGYYDGTLFHRLIPGFVVQGGKPAGEGQGSGESIWGGKFEDQFHPALRHASRGVLSMATREPDSNASQFFITLAAQPHLDNKSCAFGQVVAGYDVLDRIEAVPVGRKNRPEQPIELRRITVHANPLADEPVPLAP